MTTEDAIAWTTAQFGSDKVAALDRLVVAVADENVRQNLIAPSTIPVLWSRHIVDSLQLVGLVADVDGLWIDIGTGGGFPGLAVAIVRPAPMILVEPRKKRAAFLASQAVNLQIDGYVSVHATKVEILPPTTAAVISARAVGSIEAILTMAAAVANEKTIWLMPRGRFDPAEMIDVRHRWLFMFHVEQSLTDPGSAIVVMTGVRAK